MTTSAFGVEHEISKAKKKKHRRKPTAGRVVTGAVLPGWHGAVAGKPGHKLRAAGYELGGGMVGGPIGSGAGTYVAHQQGHYKPQMYSKSVELAKSAFGTAGDKRNTKYVGAAEGGALAGSLGGAVVGARAAGTTRKKVNREAKAKAPIHLSRHINEHGAPSSVGEATKAGYQASMSAIKDAKGGAEMLRGSKIGATVGAATGVGAYALHRRKQD